MTSKANESIKRTGDLLLSGWRLLNAGCPICNTALLSKGDLLRCPSCDMAVVKESEHNKMATGVEKLPTPPSVAEAKFEIEDDYYQYANVAPGEKFQSLNEAKKLYDIQNKRMNDVSNKLGTKMLEGFSMLSTVCPGESCRGTPLVRLAAGPMVCVCCDSEYKVSALGDLIATLKTASASSAFNGKITAASVQTAAATAATAPASATTVNTNNTPPNLTATADEILHASEADNAFFLNMNNAPILDLSSFASHGADDASSKISRKLMLGWALLDKCCQSRGCAGEVPLMRDLQGKECCVQCGFPEVSASAPAASSAARPAAPIASPSHKRTLAQAHVYDESSGSDEDSEDEEADIALFHSFRAAAAEKKNKPLSTAGVNNVTSTVSEPVVRVPTQVRAEPASSVRATLAPVVSSTSAVTNGSEVTDAVAVLKQKLSETSAALACSQSIDSSIKLADLVTKLASALKALQSLE